jgi:NADH:ubiquinone oxidoreductase subunit 5 (subunit L)/multisubunit Na+/H+ antiporter MnhA subunit
MMFLASAAKKADHALLDGVVRLVGWLGLQVSAGLAVFDREGVDGTVVDGLGTTVTEAGDAARRIQTGNVQTYLLFLVMAIVILVVVFAR